MKRLHIFAATSIAAVLLAGCGGSSALSPLRPMSGVAPGSRLHSSLPQASKYKFTVYDVPTTDAGPYWITLGPNKLMAFGEFTANNIGTVSATGKFKEHAIKVSSSEPSHMTFALGDIWFTADLGAYIASMTPAGKMNFYYTPSGSSTRGIVLGPDKNIWFCELDADSIGKFDVKTKKITEYPVKTPSAEPDGMVVGSDGALWFGEPNVGQVGRITTQGKVTEYATPTQSSAPTNLALGPDKAVWFVEYSASQIGRITTSGHITEYKTLTGSASPYAIAAGSDGALWFTESAVGQIGRITVKGTVTEVAAPGGSASDPTGISAGLGSTMWFNEQAYANNAVVKISI